MTRLIASLLLIGMLLVPAAVGAQPSTLPEIVGVRVGFAGHYKVGLWTPVEVTLRGGSKPTSGEVSLTVPDGDGVPSRVSIPVAEIPAAEIPASDGQVSVPLCARFGRIKSKLTVELSVDGQVDRKVFTTAKTADDTHFLPAEGATRKLIVCVGVDSLGVDKAVERLRQEADERTVVARLDHLGQLPGQWYGYEGVDTLVLSTSRPEIFSGVDRDSPQIAALDEWIRMGGKLVLCVGSQAESVLSEGSPLVQFTPGKFREPLTLLQTSALETYAGSSNPVPPPPGGARLELRVPLLEDVQEEMIELIEGNLPLVIRTPREFGRIVFFAGDLDQGPLSNWKDRHRLVSRLLELPMPRTEESEESSLVMRYGFDDMAGQLRSALDQFTDVWPVPFWAVAALVVFYILLIGPADYFILRKIVRRMEWTWVSFPLIMLAVSLAAYGLAYHLKGDQLRINQVDLIDVEVPSGRVRGTSWINIFSPRTESFDLSLRPRLPDGKVPPDAKVLLSWLGLPGQALGGMDPRASNPVLPSEQYDFSPKLDALRGVPIQIWSTKSFTARWNAQANGFLEVHLVDDGQYLEGRIKNTLDSPLTCVLAHERWAYMLGTIGAGQSVPIGTDVPRRQLRTWLSDPQFVPDEATGGLRAQSGLYDQSSVKLPYILRAMMFFEDAGGRRYTGLSNGYQGFVDLGHLLKANRAVLVAQGRAGPHGADLLRDGKPMLDQKDQYQHVTIYRFVLPVKRGGSRQ